MLKVEDREVRMILYKRALEIMESSEPVVGICNAIVVAAVRIESNNSVTVEQVNEIMESTDIINFVSASPVSNIEKFPELYEHKPTHIVNAKSYWFPQWEKEPRIAILRKIVHSKST